MYNVKAWLSCDAEGCDVREENIQRGYESNLRLIKAGWTPGYSGSWFCPKHKAEMPKSFPVPPGEKEEHD